jgi:hypothetical protein
MPVVTDNNAKSEGEVRENALFMRKNTALPLLEM